MGCNCGGRTRTVRVQSFAHDGRKVLWFVGEESFETIQQAKTVSDSSGQPIRRVFADTVK